MQCGEDDHANCSALESKRGPRDHVAATAHASLDEQLQPLVKGVETADQEIPFARLRLIDLDVRALALLG